MRCYPSKLKQFGDFILAGAFTSLCFLAMSADGFIIGLFAGVGVAFFGLGAVVALYLLLLPGPDVIIDETGIYCRQIGRKTISWENVRGLAKMTSSVGTLLVVSLADIEKCYPLRRGWRGYAQLWMQRLSKYGGFPPVSIMFDGLRPSLDEVWDYLKQTRAHLMAEQYSLYRVIVTHERVTCESELGDSEGVAWSAVEKVWYATTSDGPWACDDCIMLEAGATGCAIPTEAVGFGPLFDQLATRFPGFNFEPIIKGGTDDARYLCWSKPETVDTQSPH